MIFLTPNQDLTAGSGIINTSFLENIYHSFMDDAMISLGRIITVHLLPQQEEDVTTQSQHQAQQYNPFFSRTPVPQTNTRNTGTKVVHRDVQYKAQIKIGPLNNDSIHGIGNLAENEAMITVVAEALPHILECKSISIEGRRYSIIETRPIGFSTRRYLMVKLRAIQELEPPSPDVTIG